LVSAINIDLVYILPVQK